MSSAAIKSTSFNTFKALYVISYKLPIGVATMYNFPNICIYFPLSKKDIAIMLNVIINYFTIK